MHGILDLLQPEKVLLQQHLKSRKRTLETLGTLLSHELPQTTPRMLTDLLLKRERLGSTGWGNGVAIPHCRVAELEHFSMALLTLDAGIDFEATDGQFVDVFLGIVAPEEATDAHLEYLQQSAEWLGDPQRLELLRSSHDATRLLNVLRES